MNAILAIDQGTTATTALVVGCGVGPGDAQGDASRSTEPSATARGSVLGRASVELPQHYPAPAWVEHEPEEIWETVVAAVSEALRSAGLSAERVRAIGVTNQRETALLWDRETGRPARRAIVWQDRRTAEQCSRLKESGIEPRLREVTGLVVDPYFSATKVAWMLDDDPRLRERAAAGRLAFGTVESFLVHRLAGADGQAPHVTDVTNASRTLLMNLAERRWSPELCALFGVPEALLPRIVPSSGIVARTRSVPCLRDGTPISGLAGDQQAALFGHGCFAVGDAKCTYGTGAFVLANVGLEPLASRHGLLSTIAWQIGDEPTYALEGSAFVAGAAVQWLRDLGVIRQSGDVEKLAREVSSSDGLVFVPALSGLGAPHWDPEARGMIAGITRGTRASHLARATLEAIALEVDDLLSAMSDDLGKDLTRLSVDGGAARNDLLLQLQSDLSRLTVERPQELESTARGAAMLAGIGVGLFRDGRHATNLLPLDRRFRPEMSDRARNALRTRWADAVGRSRGRLGLDSH